MGKLSNVILAVGGVVAVGLCGYGVGVHSHNQAKRAVASTKISRPHLSNKKSSAFRSSASRRIDSTENDNSSFYNSNTGTILGCSDIHQFVNKYGETPAAYLVDHKGYSAHQALSYVYNLPNGRNFMSSGEIQDYNADNNQTNNANNLSMHQDANGDD